jgi:hypothetical protein
MLAGPTTFVVEGLVPKKLSASPLQERSALFGRSKVSLRNTRRVGVGAGGRKQDSLAWVQATLGWSNNVDTDM